MLKRLFARYAVVAEFDGRRATHYASTLADALGWVACYPAGDTCRVYERFLGHTARVPVAVRA